MMFAMVHIPSILLQSPMNSEKNILKAWAWLDTVLPKGSHVLVMGLA